MLLIKSILLVCAAGLAMAGHVDYDALVSGACFTGKDTTQQGEHGVDIFRNPRNHPSAVASILLHSADKAEFRPREKGIITDRNIYGEFVRRVFDFPGFKNHKKHSTSMKLNGDRDDFRRQLADHYRSEWNDPQKVAKAVERLIPRELEQGSSQQKWLLNYMILHNEQGHNMMERQGVMVEILAVELTLCRNEQTGEVEIERQSAKMQMNCMCADKDFIVKNAKELASRVDTVSVHKFLSEMSTNEREGGDEDDEKLQAWFGGRSGFCGQSSQRSAQWSMRL